MFAHNQIFHDSKENVKSSVSVKPHVHSRKGLQSLSVNRFTDSKENSLTKKLSPGSDANTCQKPAEKKGLKVNDNVQKKKSDLPEDTYPEIENMYICEEQDDDYEDILPKCERIQKAHIDSLFLNYTYTRFDESTVNDKSPSPLKEFKSFDFPELPLLTDIKFAPLFDDTELDLIPLTNNLYIE